MRYQKGVAVALAGVLALAVVLAFAGCSLELHGKASVLAGLNRPVKSDREELVMVTRLLAGPSGEVAAEGYLKAKGYDDEKVEQVIAAAKAAAACGGCK